LLIPARPLSQAELDVSLEQALTRWNRRGDLWLFAYGSLVWNPELEFREHRLATVHGYHRSLCLWSRINRGTPHTPGLVLGLDKGGCCRGLVYRLHRRDARAQLRNLWKREMVFGSYQPSWLSARGSSASVQALAFVMDRSSPAYTGRLPEAEIMQAIALGVGRYGSCADYVVKSAEGLLAHGIADKRLLRLRERINAQSA
jgi:glutathione-specific gamma-glutamylcyclotransferase